MLNFGRTKNGDLEHEKDVLRNVIKVVKQDPELVAVGDIVALKVSGEYYKDFETLEKVAKIVIVTEKSFAEFLVKKLGGKGSFLAKSFNSSREFDGAIGNIWYEAKSGKYWEMLLSSKEQLNRFYQDMGRGLSVAKSNGAIYELHSNTYIPKSIKDWLTKKGIKFTEWL